MTPLKPAEMQEANLTSMVLFMKRIDIAGLGHCDFMNRPGSLMLPCQPGMWAEIHLLSSCPFPVLSSHDAQQYTQVWRGRWFGLKHFPARGKHSLKIIFKTPQTSRKYLF